MATIRKITPSQGISDFRQMRQEGGGGFRALAQAMDVAYDYLLPSAIDEATKKGDALGREISRGQIGDPQAAVVQSTMGPVDPNAVLAGDAMAALGKGNDRYRNAIASIESAGSGDYSAIGPTNAKLGRALGRYQIMEANIGPWSREALGRAVSADEFLANPQIQDAIFDHKFGGYVQKYGEEGAAQAWFAGEGGVGKLDRQDVLGTTVGGYGQKFVAALGGGGGGVTASTSGPATAPTVMRGADGKLTSRLFGPTSNPIMAAHDAAAGVAYQSDVFLKAGQDFVGMSEQFAMNPEGFKQAADEYVKAMVESAPEPFRMDVQSKLENEASRRFLGLVDEKHANIRQRAANSSAALSEMWADDLASAIASGNPAEIEAARTELGSVLAARERLPGSTWTPEQSANYMRKAEEAGQASIKKAQDEQGAAWKTALNTVIDTAKAGRRAVDEALLNNPMVQQMFPELTREAMAFTTLRDELPSFNMMTPAEQQAALAEMKAQPVTEEWENDLYGAAEKVAGANAAAWKSDPIKRAGEVLTNNPPPVLPELDPMNPQVFASALAARAEYGVALMDQGFTDRAIFVSQEEAKTLGAMFGKEVPPELKAMAAGMVVQAMGPNAAGFFKQINTSDPVIPHVGGLMAAGGDTAVATEAMIGQSLLDQKVVQAPTATAVDKGMSGIKDAIASTPGAAGAMESIRDTATAIYAARIPAGADETTQARVMEEAWQAALGQSNSLGRTTGGVQDVGGRKVLLPPQMAGEDLDKAMSRAFGDPGGFWSWAPAVAGNPDMWVKAAGGIPALGGEPIGADLWLNGEITMTPVGGTKYMLSVTRNGVVIDIGVQGQPDDVPFIFDAEALVEASLVP
jgi:hypothetical protein